MKRVTSSNFKCENSCVLVFLPFALSLSRCTQDIFVVYLTCYNSTIWNVVFCITGLQTFTNIYLQFFKVSIIVALCNIFKKIQITRQRISSMKILNSFLSWNYSVLIQQIKLVEDVKRCTRGACFLTFYSLTFTCTCVVSTFIPMYIWSTSSESSFLYFLSPTQSKSKTAFKTFFFFFSLHIVEPLCIRDVVNCKM